jgi:hypothetical protein
LPNQAADVEQLRDGELIRQRVPGLCTDPMVAVQVIRGGE